MSVSTTASTMAYKGSVKVSKGYPSYTNSRCSTPASLRMPIEPVAGIAATPPAPSSVRMAVASTPPVPISATTVPAIATTRGIPTTTITFSTPRIAAVPPVVTNTPLLRMHSMPSVQTMPTTSTPRVPAVPATYAAPPPPSTPSVPVAATIQHPIAPSKLTEGLPDLKSIQMQKEAYLRALEEQERQALAQLEEQRAQQVEHLRLQGEQQKKAYGLQVDQQVQHHDLALTQQHSEQMMLLNKQYSSQRGVLEHQANSLVMDYQQKKAHEDMLMQQYSLQREMHDSQLRFQEELGKIKTNLPGDITHMPILPPTPGLAASGSMASLTPRLPGTSYTPPPVVGMRSHSHVPMVTASHVPRVAA